MGGGGGGGGRSDDAGRDVEEAHPQALAPAGAEGLGEGEDADPAGDVVGEGRGQPPQPVGEEVLHGAWFIRSLDELADRLLWRAAAETVVVLDVDGGGEERRDVGDQGEEAPAPEVVEAELLARCLALAAHDEAQVRPAKR